MLSDKDTQNEEDRENEIVTFVGIPRKWVNPTLKIYSIIFLGFAVWISFQEFSNAKTLVEKLGTIFTYLATFSVVEGVGMVAIIQLVDIFMYLTNRFRTNVKKQVEIAKAEGEAEGEAKGVAKGKTETYKLWADWNTRRIEAETRGIPFDEPPPEPPTENKKS